MHILPFSPDRALPITEFDSRLASAQPLADGSGEAHVYAVHLDPGGEIGPHPAGFAQLFLVIAGEAWVSGGDGIRHTVAAANAAVIARGELHAKGSTTGCSAIMIQLEELATSPPEEK